MKRPSEPADPARAAQIRAELRRDLEQRQKGYREQALKLLPHVCASCGREFSGKRLRELTVHHRDHNFRNNPPDGGNWELLCLYCHDHEHEKTLRHGGGAAGSPAGDAAPPIGNPFAGLDSIVRDGARAPDVDQGPVGRSPAE
jgi:hypothetical protein